jgi:protein TonB
MGYLASKSKAFGVAGAAALHSCVVLACVLVSTRPIAKPLRRVEPLRINLTEPTFRPPPPTPVAGAPKPKPIESEAMSPDAEPQVESAVAPEAPDGLAEPAQSKEPVSGPAATTDHQQGGRARTLEEAKQAILAALVADLEQEKRYPAAARRLGVEGLVMARVQIDSTGRIVGAGIKESGAHPLLETAAADALQRVQKKWRPIPLPEPVTVNVPIRYNLEK